MGYYSRFWFIFLFFVLAAPASGQFPSYVFHTLSIKDGLSENTVRCIIEDERGFMWFGTEDGFNRYDGYKFIVYKNNPDDQYSVSSSIARCFYSDRKGNLWIGGRHGLNLYDHSQDKFYNYHSSDYPALKSLRGHIEGIVEDKNGALWIAAGSEGLYKLASLDQAAENFSLPAQVKSSFLTCININKAGDFLIGTNDGLFRFSPSNNKFTDLSGRYGKGYQVRSIYLDGEENIWLVTSDGLKCIRNGDGVMEEYEHDPRNHKSLNGNNVLRMIPEGNKYLIGIDGKGVDLFDPQTGSFSHYTMENGSQLSSNNVTTLYKDSKGTLWAGTFMNGINFSNNTTNFFVYVRNSFSSPRNIPKGVVTSFLKDSKENLWISTDGGGLLVRKKGSGNFTRFSSGHHKSIIGSDAVLDLLEDKQGNIWITTYAGGLTRYTAPGNFKIYRHDIKNPYSIGSDKLLSIAESDQEIWVSTHGLGLSVLNKKTEKFRHYRHEPGNSGSIPSDWVHRIFVDRSGTLWLATFNGISEYIPQTNSFKSYRFSTDQVTGNFSYEIYEDSKGNFWVGTNGLGLVLFDRGRGTCKTFTTKDGLSDNCIKTIMEDEAGNLWLAGNNDISKFNIYTHKAIPYTINDGLPPCSFFHHSTFKDKYGKIYFGTNEGYLIINPKLSVEQTSFPKVVLTELRIFNKPVRPGKDSLLKSNINEAEGIVIPYHQNSLSFEFAALNFNIPKRNTYAYKLEGFDKDWNLSGKNRVATYTNLNPGKYTFKVKASNSTKSWGENWTGFEITITPPFWLTWWFKLFTGISFLVATAVFFSIRTRNIRRKNRWLKDQITERTRDLQEANMILGEQNQRVMSQSEKILQQQKELLDKKYELEKNNRQLAEWNEFQNRLIGILGHDLRGPLQQFSLMLKYQTEDSSEWVNAKLKETARSLSTLATDLLGWITLQSRQGEVQYTSFSWDQVLEKVLKEVEPFRSEKQLVFSVKTSDGPLLHGVFPIVASAVRNILSNSIRFSDAEGLIEIEEGQWKEGFSGLRITDYGKGFDAARVNRLIQGEAFKGMKDQALTEGSGLGMAICYDMIRRTGGWIEAASLPRSGATFYIFIPCSEQHVPETAPAKGEKQLHLSQDNLEILRGKKLLLVDDDDELRWQIVKLMNNYVDMHEVRSAKEALAWLKDHTPDMALLDIRMPGESGLDLCRTIKSSPDTAHVPCTLISGETGDKIRKEAFESGADAFFTKPLQADELLLHISTYFENRSKVIKRFFQEGIPVDQITSNSLNKEFLSELVNLVELHLASGSLNVDFLAAEMGLSRASLYRRLKSLTGQTVNDFIKDIRMRKSLGLLQNGDMNISEVASETGFNSPSYFTTSFKKHFGYSPTELKK